MASMFVVTLEVLWRRNLRVEDARVEPIGLKKFSCNLTVRAYALTPVP